MDESGAEGETVEAIDGVTLRKRYEAEEFHQPAVVYEFESDRSEPAAVSLIETIPEQLSPSDLGFTGASTERRWEIKGPKLVFETEIEPNESVRTACVARVDAAGDIEALLGAPDAFEVEAAATTGESESFSRSADAQSESPAPESPEDAPSEAVADVDRERVVEQFVAELRAGAVSPESVEFLRQELGAASKPPRSVEARLKQLQADLADVRAYTNALEAFLDEKGGAAEVIDRLEGRLDDLATALADVEDGLASHDEHIEVHDDDIEALRSDVEDLGGDVHGLTRELETLEDDLASVDETLEAVDEHLERIEALDERLGGLEDRLPEYDIDDRIGDLDDRIGDLDDDLAEVTAFTENLRSVFER